ncbi:hypothetical protein K440DRAFT_622566 [Wilcoxina mikolae CBS 423.85]|nr:hypothetical protein K440DRAFT_622566 [Wilcoxina mikolae CBS 423.85]
MVDQGNALDEIADGFDRYSNKWKRRARSFLDGMYSGHMKFCELDCKLPYCTARCES